jgi:hypothetical protein
MQKWQAVSILMLTFVSALLLREYMKMAERAVLLSLLRGPRSTVVIHHLTGLRITLVHLIISSLAAEGRVACTSVDSQKPARGFKTELMVRLTDERLSVFLDHKEVTHV